MLHGKLTDPSFHLAVLNLQTMSSLKTTLDTMNITVIWYACEQFFFLGLSFGNTYKYI